MAVMDTSGKSAVRILEKKYGSDVGEATKDVISVTTDLVVRFVWFCPFFFLSFSLQSSFFPRKSKEKNIKKRKKQRKKVQQKKIRNVGEATKEVISVTTDLVVRFLSIFFLSF